MISGHWYLKPTFLLATLMGFLKINLWSAFPKTPGPWQLPSFVRSNSTTEGFLLGGHLTSFSSWTPHSKRQPSWWGQGGRSHTWNNPRRTFLPGIHMWSPWSPHNWTTFREKEVTSQLQFYSKSLQCFLGMSHKFQGTQIAF